jgi:hypothetical protein
LGIRARDRGLALGAAYAVLTEFASDRPIYGIGPD